MKTTVGQIVAILQPGLPLSGPTQPIAIAQGGGFHMF